MRLPAALRGRPSSLRAGTLRSGFAVAALVTLAPATAGGCANAVAHSSGDRPAAVASASPAAAAGGACFLLDFATIRQVTGVSFDVAASSQSQDTFTCVLERHNGSYPDLTLAVTPTDADPAVFGSTVQPKGATAVTGLGKAGYSALLPAAPGAGPAVEVGWLSANGRLLVLRYRSSTGTADQAAAVAPKFTELAHKIDQDSQD